MTTLYVRDGEIYREADGRGGARQGPGHHRAALSRGGPGSDEPGADRGVPELKLGGLDYEVFRISRS